MKRLRFMKLLSIVVLGVALAACGGRAGDESDTGPESANPETPVNDNAHQGEDPTQGEDDEGDAKGTTDEGLDALGGGFEWRREGGIAGFCDVVTVLAGTATIASCAADPPEILGEVTLSAEQSRQVMTWIEEFRTFDHSEADPATADAMSVTLIFEGEGDDEPSEDDIAAMQQLAQEVLRSTGE